MSGCTLRLTKNSPLQTTLVDEATGHVKYKIETPVKIAHVLTQVRKFESHAQPPHHSEEDTGSDLDDDITLCGSMKGKLGSDGVKGEEMLVDPEVPGASNEIARIYWKLLTSDKIAFQGREYVRSEFLQKCGKAEGSYTFTGPGDVQYRWTMDAKGLQLPKLVTADEKETVIAEFHCTNHSRNKQKAQLEVRAEGMEMLDRIVLTFVYVEHKRRQREGKDIGCQTGPFQTI